MPTVSVIMLAWNQGALLHEAVGSILDQSMSDLELVLVDNGSTDGEVARVLAARPDPRIRVFRQETNLGVAAGANFGIEQSRSPWIAIMDSDDRSHRLRLELQLLAAAADPTLDVITAGAMNMDAEGRLLDPFEVACTPGDIAGITMFRSPIAHPTVLARREIYAAIPYRSEADLASDYDWISRVVERFKVGCVALPLLHYRRHTGSSTQTRFVYHEASICAIRLAVARRRAGRREDFAALCAEVQQWRQGGAVEEVYVHFARRAAAERFFLLATMQAALAVRARGSIGNRLRYLGFLWRAVAQDKGAWPEALAGLGKGPFWSMLKRAGFPAGGRY